MPTFEKIKKEQSSVSQPKNQLEEAMFLIKDVFSFLYSESEQSIELLELGLKDSLAQYVDDAFKNPLETLFDNYINTEQAIKHILNISVKEYFARYTDFISEVYLYKTTGNFLHYSILLKYENDEKMNQLYQFINSYEQTKLNSRFKIIFDEIPVELSTEFVQQEVNETNYIKVV